MKAGCTKKEIAEYLHVHPSTITKEIQRNGYSGYRCYRSRIVPKRAAHRWRCRHLPRRFKEDVRKKVDEMILSVRILSVLESYVCMNDSKVPTNIKFCFIDGYIYSLEWAECVKIDREYVFGHGHDVKIAITPMYHHRENADFRAKCG